MVAGHRVTQQTLVGAHLFALRPLHYLEFGWLGHHHLARPLYLRTNGDYHVRAEPEAIIVRIPRAELAQRRALERDQDFGGSHRQAFARANKERPPFPSP